VLAPDADFAIRPLSPADQAILWEMLYQALQTAEASESPLSRDVVRQPDFARYVEKWGREGDRGFIAHDAADQDDALGAVWCRASLARQLAPPGGEPVEELAFAVRSGQRRRGIGAALLTQWVRANPEQSAVRLRVAPSSPAVRLYERFGFRVVEESAGAVTMRRDT
jgi:ribosomal protein S18 acetylase RimI-like enzyme